MFGGLWSLVKGKVSFYVWVSWQVIASMTFCRLDVVSYLKNRQHQTKELWLPVLQLSLLLYFTLCSFFHRHFLFKTGTGTTPLFSTATPGYTMASGSVYSPPTRPLPRNTLSRSAFKFKKSSKYCSWKCTALCAVGVSVLLAILLSYFIGESHFVCHYEQWCLVGCMWTVTYQPLNSEVFGNSKSHKDLMESHDCLEKSENLNILQAFCSMFSEFTSKKYFNYN